MNYYVVAVVADSYEDLRGGAKSVSGTAPATINADGFVHHEPLVIRSSCVDPMVRLYNEEGDILAFTMHRGVMDEGGTIEFAGRVANELSN